MKPERLAHVVEAARHLVDDADRCGLDLGALAEDLAVLEQAMAELVAEECAACGTPILGREGLRVGRTEGGWVHYHRTCCRDWGRG